MQTITWTVRPLGAPEIHKHCKTCGTKQPFVSSGLFRVNANHHILDIWLVHRCATCDRTWNMEIHERIHPRKLDAALLTGYQANDPALAMRCAHDRTLHQRAGLEADYAGVVFAIDGPGIDLSQLDAPVEIILACDQAMNVRVRRVLQEKLTLSATGLKRLIADGTVSCEDVNLLKAKLAPGLRIMIALR